MTDCPISTIMDVHVHVHVHECIGYMSLCNSRLSLWFQDVDMDTNPKAEACSNASLMAFLSFS